MYDIVTFYTLVQSPDMAALPATSSTAAPPQTLPVNTWQRVLACYKHIIGESTFNASLSKPVEVIIFALLDLSLASDHHKLLFCLSSAGLSCMLILDPRASKI